MANRIYITRQGDVWDLIAFRVYGQHRGDENLMYWLLESNYPLKDVASFGAGVVVNVPELVVQTAIPLVPWKNATIGPTLIST